jgi:RNA polymerase sigma factor (sigma-70 family)
MIEKSDSDSRSAAFGAEAEAEGALSGVDLWFGRSVLPLEAALMEFLQHNWRNKSELKDFRQEIYVRVYEAALRQIPERPRQFLFATARNLLIDRVRHEQVVPIEAAADLEALEIAADAPGADRVLMARDELRRVQAALERIPPRCREALLLGRIEGLSRREIAARMGIAESAAAQYLSRGIRALVNVLCSEAPTVGRKP